LSVGLIALLDDVAAIAKAAAASIDDVVLQATKAGTKAAGVVIDDAAVTPRYVTGLSPAREIPIIAKIALGSLKNKLIILLPAALLLSLFAPWAITPLLMIVGAYLCYEGVEKLWEIVHPHGAHAHEAELESVALNAESEEDRKVAGAIKTDFILSAEIMAITLAAVPGGSFLMQAAVLFVVGVGITAMVYGAVALIVKADDLGLGLARRHPKGSFLNSVGCAFVRGMPVFLSVLGKVGTAAMIWVGGGIVVHGLEEYGYGWLAETFHHLAEAAAHAVPVAAGFVTWAVEACGARQVGIAVGIVTIPLAGYVLAPAWRRAKHLLRGRRKPA
jgi:predicted DNA repair protein MutK